MSLNLERLCAGYDGGTVLHSIDLALDQGQVTAIVGHNGAGKSTLLHTIAGLHPSTAGRIILDGRDVTVLRAHRRNRLGIAYVPQGARVFATLTVDEHLTVSFRKTRYGSAWTPAAVRELFPALRDRHRHRAALLSGGERQMLAIARSLLTQPRLLLLDEPTEGLAPAVVDQLADVIAVLTSRGMTLLLATPQLEFATAVAGRLAVLTSGRLTQQFDAAEGVSGASALRSALAPLAP
ncbi:ATP-binding cassette domain-containing protein [Micromonospora sediminicola]|uniref:ABC transporter ATP-binding protein n=1 Tax=Micromonospora sediminicola TaxID=946078 RepID=UPI0033D3AA80